MKKWVKILLVILAAAVLIALTAVLLPFVLSLREPENSQAFKQWIDSLGFWGVLALFGIQVLQIVIAIIPGEPIEIIAGVMYGTWGGLAICLSGILISNIIIYYLIRKLGKKAIDKVIKKEESLKYNFIFKENNINYLLFLLFFIPGVPKDVLVYLSPFTKVKPLDFFLIATFARIPRIITSTWAGSNISDGNLLMSVIIFAITGLIGLIGIYVHNRFIKSKEEK